ncbi:MAG: DUF6825 family protein [Cyanobacteria bacterium J06639_18]
MTNPLVEAFFVGRAVAEVLTERMENTFTDALSELGKFEAEAKEHLRAFTEEVMEKANHAAEAAGTGEAATGMGQTSSSEPDDLQAVIDELRSDIAELRSEIQRYRSNSV